MFAEWSQPIRGDEVEALIRQLDVDLAGVYVWRRCSDVVINALGNQDAFLKWITDVAAAPYATASDMKMVRDKPGTQTLRPGLLRSVSVSIGGGTITSEDKIRLLENMGKEIDDRTWLAELVGSSMELFGPVIYVGETSCLKTRFQDHISGQTGLLSCLQAVGLSLSSTMLRYLLLPESTKQSRKLIEEILTHSLLAPFTIRPG